MHVHQICDRRFLGMVVWGVTTLIAINAQAQESAPPPPAPSVVAQPAPVEAAAPPPAPVAAPPVEVAPPPPALAPVVEAPAPPPPAAIKSNFGLRVGSRIQGSSDPEAFDDLSLDTIYVEARFSGSVNSMFSWHANFNGKGMPAGSSGTASVMDLVLKFDPVDYFRVWAGRLLVPSDRSNFSGPYFMSPWNYPGVYGGTFVGPKTGATGRDDGVVVWGNIMGGKAKYFLGGFNLDNPVQHPLYSGRINIALLGEEPGFWGNSTYYGEKDLVAIGAGFQYQKNGSGAFTSTSPLGSEDLNVFIADLLAEKNFAGIGTLTLEGAYYHFDEGQPTKQAFYVLASYLTPNPIGYGKLQPLVRWQQASPQAGGSDWTVLDLFVTYVMQSFDLRLAVGYQRTDLGAAVGNAIQIGLQMQQ